MSSFAQDVFLGKTDLSGVETEITNIETQVTTLDEKSLYTDGTKSMSADLNLGDNQCVDVSEIQFTERASGITPPADTIGIFAKTGGDLWKVSPGPSEEKIGTVTSVTTAAGDVNGVTLTGTVTTTGELALGGAVSVNNDNWSGADLAIANGGTNASDEQTAINNLSQVSGANTDDVLYKDGNNNVAWSSDYLKGSGASTDNAIVRFDGSGGNLFNNSLGILDDNGVLSGITEFKVGDSDGCRIADTDTGVVFLEMKKNAAPQTNSTWGTALGIGAGNSWADGRIGKDVAIGYHSQLNMSDTDSGDNISIGWNSMANISGSSTNYNVAIGSQSMRNMTGDGGVAVGWSSQLNNVGANCTCVGLNSLRFATNTTNSVAVGSGSLQSQSGTATGNIAVGYQAGSNYETTESNNILLGHTGVIADSQTIRIGLGQSKCFIDGITDVQADETYERVLINPADGQLATDTPAYGEQYIHDNTANDTAVTQNVWTLLNATGRNNGPANDFLQNVGYSMTYVGTPDILAQVNVSVSWENDSTSNVKVQLGVFKNANASPMSNLRLRTHLDDGTDYPRNSSLSGFANLVNGDTLTVQCLNETDGDDIIFWSTNFNINKIGLT